MKEITQHYKNQQYKDLIAGHIHANVHLLHHIPTDIKLPHTSLYFLHV